MVKWPASPVRGGRIREKGEMIDVSTMENLPGRSLMEIRASLGVHIRMAAESCILAGQDLIEAKAQLGHGAWLPFLKEFGISSSTAANWMQVAREIPAGSPLARLPYSKALALLALPAGEREEFAAENDAEQKTAAEIKRLIAEKEAAQELARKNARTAEENYEKYKKANNTAIAAQQYANDWEQKAQSLSRELERKQPERVVEKTVDVPPADYADLKYRAAQAQRDAEDAVKAAMAAEQRARDAENALEEMRLQQGAGAPALGDLERLTDAVNRFIADTQLLAVNPGELARREKETDAVIRRLSRHVIDLQAAVSKAAFQAEGAVV